MLEKLNERDRRAIRLGVISAAVILCFVGATAWLEHWRQVRASLAKARKDLSKISVSETRRAGLVNLVPAFEMPRLKEEQKFLFREKINEQLKKAGIGGKPLEILSTTRSDQPGYELLRIRCSGTGKYDNVLNLLAGLKENPYLAGIDELRLECAGKKREQLQTDMVVTTFVKQEK